MTLQQRIEKDVEVKLRKEVIDWLQQLCRDEKFVALLKGIEIEHTFTSQTTKLVSLNWLWNPYHCNEGAEKIVAELLPNAIAEETKRLHKAIKDFSEE